MDIAKLLAQVDALENMTRSEGWRTYCAWLRAQREVQLRNIESPTTDPQLILRASGSLAQLRALETWPDEQAKVIRQQIEKFTKQRG
jgi:hypothetical protein